MSGQGLQLPSYNSITGAWVLDVRRSDNMEGYLQCLRTPQAAIQAQVAGEQQHESRNVIALDESSLVLHKRTNAINFTQNYELDQEKSSQTRLGVLRSTASLGDRGQHDGFVIVSNFTSEGGEAIVVEIRQVLSDGLSHVQEINLRNLTTGDQHVSRRLWVRVPMTPVDWAQLVPA